MLIYETRNFIIEAVEEPHISREDGGHIKISPKIKVVDRTQLSPKLAIEAMRLTMVAGEAMVAALNKRGIDIGRINYQDNGNWSVFKPAGPYFHIHLYGRAKSAKVQKWGDACYFPQRSTGYYDNFQPLNNDDVLGIKEEIEKTFKQPKYRDKEWGL
jgi:diadenosine tetraphosphate (Ap4A) HIT family hydrolase